MDLLVLVFSIPLGYEIFHQLITHVLILIILLGARSMILRNLVFSHYLSICK